MKTEDDILIDEVSKELYKRLGGNSIFSLPWVSQVVLVVLDVQGYTDNGGFGYFLRAILKVIRRILFTQTPCVPFGADESAKYIEVAVSLFPFPEPHLHGDQRRDYLRNHCTTNDGRTNNDSQLVKLGDRVIDNSDMNMSLLAKYIREHLEEIRKS